MHDANKSFSTGESILMIPFVQRCKMCVLIDLNDQIVRAIERIETENENPCGDQRQQTLKFRAKIKNTTHNGRADMFVARHWLTNFTNFFYQFHLEEKCAISL